MATTPPRPLNASEGDPRRRLAFVYIYDGVWPRGATRAIREVRSLAAAGVRVRVVCRDSNGARSTQRFERVVVRRLPRLGPRRVADWLSFPLFLSPIWAYTIWRTARKPVTTAIVVCDLPLAPLAVIIGGLLRLPVYYDMAEPYPLFLRSMWLLRARRWYDVLVRNPVLAAWLEQWVLRRVRSVIVVSNESRKRCEALGVPASRIALVRNTPELMTVRSIDLARPPSPQAERTVLYVGILIFDRGLDVALHAMARVRDAVPEARLVIVGDGPERARLEYLSRQLGLEDVVQLAGWKDPDEVDSYYSDAAVGLLPFLDTPHIRTTLANKLFDYMARGLAVVAVEAAPMRRIVESTGAGLTVPFGDAEAMAQAILRLLQNTDLRRRCASRGREAVSTDYNWSVDERRFLDAVGVSSAPP